MIFKQPKAKMLTFGTASAETAMMFARCKAPIDKPRIQGRKTGREIELNSAIPGGLCGCEQVVMDQMALGLSTRHYGPRIGACATTEQQEQRQPMFHYGKKALDELMGAILANWTLSSLL